MPARSCKIVSPEEFDRLFQAEAIIAEFASVDEKATYSKKDAFLIYLIRQLILEVFRKENDQEDQLFVGDDWWPNHTRYIEATPKYCTIAFFEGLRKLLTDEYKKYRIQICVYSDLMVVGSYIGSIALHSNRALIEKPLFDALPEDVSAYLYSG